MTNERQLLLDCARSSVDACDPHQLVRELPQDSAAWDAFVAAATEHGMIPLACSQLLRHCSDILPPDILSRLHTFLHNTARRNFSITRELISVLDLLSAEGIPVLVYKGPVLAATAYDNIALRGFSDVDLLIAPDDLFRAMTVLEHGGYLSDTPIEHHQRKLLLRYQHEIRMVRGDMLVELHWRLVARYVRFGLDTQSALNRPATVNIGGSHINTFSTEDHLIVLCVHGSKHFWNRLIWICDIAHLIRAHADGLDWGAIRSRSQALGVWRMVALGLLLAQKLLNISIPEDILRAVTSDASVLKAESQITQWLSGKQSMPDMNYMHSGFLRYHLSLRNRWFDKVLYVLGRSVNPSLDEIRNASLPSWLGWCYPLIRPFRLAMKYLRTSR